MPEVDMDGNKSSRALPLCGLVRPMRAEGALRSLHLAAGVVYLFYLSYAAYNEASQSHQRSQGGRARKSLPLSRHGCYSASSCFLSANTATSALPFGGNRFAWKNPVLLHYHKEPAGASRSHWREYRSLALRRARVPPASYRIVSHHTAWTRGLKRGCSRAEIHAR